jgi:hypothetical protein
MRREVRDQHLREQPTQFGAQVVGQGGLLGLNALRWIVRALPRHCLSRCSFASPRAARLVVVPSISVVLRRTKPKYPSSPQRAQRHWIDW